MRVRSKTVHISHLSCAGTKIQQFLEYKKLLYICVENIKIIIVYVHKDDKQGPSDRYITVKGN